MPRSVKRNPLVQVIIDYTIITLACIGTALVIQLFQLPNHFVFGGVTGMAVLLSSVTPVGFSSWNILINLILILAGFVFLGKSFGIRTVYVSVFTSLCYKVLDYIFPVGEPLTDQPFLETLLVTFTIAVLAAILFDRGACSGGTDILAMILKQKIKVNIGHALLMVDIVSVLFSFVLYDLKIGLFSLVGLLTKAFVVIRYWRTLTCVSILRSYAMTRHRCLPTYAAPSTAAQPCLKRKGPTRARSAPWC